MGLTRIMGRWEGERLKWQEVPEWLERFLPVPDTKRIERELLQLFEPESPFKEELDGKH